MAKTSGKKKRADLLLYEQGEAASQELAARLIMAGRVFIVSEAETESSLRRVEKPGDLLPVSVRLEYRDKNPYVSRGAYKLLTALEYFKIDVSGLVALDAGASTGGFTDCLLRHGASRIYAVDVGKNQLHEKLRADSRVISLEGVNLRLHPAGSDLAASLLPEKVDLVVADVSFISLKEILPACLSYLKPGGRIIALIKPQFELGYDNTVKGVVRDEKLRDQAVEDVLAFAKDELGLSLQGVVPAAIKGPKGNQEYLAVWGSTV
ncbi:MAG: TlyA family RNA methyltransferase [Deltaproteobacteria bacterium]|nr:TlyA family RNA methyltransferase [Deltaproteobacteria bacterium]